MKPIESPLLKLLERDQLLETMPSGLFLVDYSGFITSDYTGGHPGYVNGTVGRMSLFSIQAKNIEISRNEVFDFMGAYINIHPNSPARSITVEGILEGVSKYSETIEFKDPYPLTWHDYNYRNIDALRFVGDEYVVVDNLTFQEVSPVPIPAADWLFGTGILGLIGFSKRKTMLKTV